METTSSREIYANPWMTIREDTFVRPDGGRGIYGVVDKPHYALVIALEGDSMMLVEQFRYPIGLRRWEFPQGTAPDRATMDPAELAARELREETGLTARSWHPLGLLDVAPGLSSQRGRAFLATDLDAGEPDREDTEADMRAAWVRRTEFEDMVRAGEITDAQSIAAYALLLLSGR
ncbi:NUDIX hydrolase [Actinomycetospora sp. NBRC 106378]|uniref:NUDIX domain-containing protein n=1 Tax=Actinomycetospora sp. NBRC 106378 TaxID=3032208 RepID=UPI0024A30C89|nr:NUDIX hydrolase [Actinomycetospora sp. NBRC 106378]GLZ55848.1 ADP-ribose pyrophosphatase [Actinomycetospora sp. NBRC 106378]